MRVSPLAGAFDDEVTVLREAARSAAVTHNHPEGIRGAQATALAIWMGRRGRPVPGSRKALAGRCGYDLDRPLDTIRPH
jgi:ADP-ribosylglycohydrolase